MFIYIYTYIHTYGLFSGLIWCLNGFRRLNWVQAFLKPAGGFLAQGTWGHAVQCGFCTLHSDFIPEKLKKKKSTAGCKHEPAVLMSYYRCFYVYNMYIICYYSKLAFGSCLHPILDLQQLYIYGTGQISCSHASSKAFNPLRARDGWHGDFDTLNVLEGAPSPLCRSFCFRSHGMLAVGRKLS